MSTPTTTPTTVRTGCEAPARINALTQQALVLSFVRDAIKQEATPEHALTGILRVFTECSCGSLHPLLDGSALDEVHS